MQDCWSYFQIPNITVNTDAPTISTIGNANILDSPTQVIANPSRIERGRILLEPLDLGDNDDSTIAAPLTTPTPMPITIPPPTKYRVPVLQISRLQYVTYQNIVSTNHRCNWFRYNLPDNSPINDRLT